MAESDIARISTTTNATVVQLPERKHPGIVIQGDSLYNLCALLQEAQEKIDSNNIDECRELLDELSQLMGGYLQSYEEAIGKDA